MKLPDTIKTIQRAVGVTADGVFGPVSAGAVLRHLAAVELVSPVAVPSATLDERSAGVLATLDVRARERFAGFYHLAAATAATFGCTYVLISGHRSWEEQDALYAIGRTKPGNRVTNAKGGQSNHNFGIAGDFGVFQGKAYLDSSNPELAARVHKACSLHAAGCGLEWGGSWTTMADMPHYEIRTGLGMAEMREIYQRKGSVL